MPNKIYAAEDLFNLPLEDYERPFHCAFKCGTLAAPYKVILTTESAQIFWQVMDDTRAARERQAAKPQPGRPVHSSAPAFDGAAHGSVTSQNVANEALIAELTGASRGRIYLLRRQDSQGRLNNGPHGEPAKIDYYRSDMPGRGQIFNVFYKTHGEEANGPNGRGIFEHYDPTGCLIQAESLASNGALLYYGYCNNLNPIDDYLAGIKKAAEKPGTNPSTSRRPG